MRSVKRRRLAGNTPRPGRCSGPLVPVAVFVTVFASINSAGLASAPVAAAAESVPVADQSLSTRSKPAPTDRTLDRFTAKLASELGESNRGLPNRVQMRSRTAGALEITWAIDHAPEGGLSLDVIAHESERVLDSVKRSSLSYRRVILKGTFGLPSDRGVVESVVVRAVYVRSTVRAIDFDRFDAERGRNVLDLADERRLAAVLGGHGIPQEPVRAPAT
jgi:hypothetical protein